MAAESFPLHHQSEAVLAVNAASLFAYLDDHRRLASHMGKPSLMTAGASMRIDIDEHQGQAVGWNVRRGRAGRGPYRSGRGGHHDG